MKKSIFNAFLLMITIGSYAQYGYRDSNRIGITVGVNQSTVNTNNFKTMPELGWNGGLSIRGNFYNNWDMVYSIQFSESAFSVATKKIGIIDENVKYKMPGAQLSLQASYVILENHLSVEFGPIIQANGKLSLNANQENNLITGTTLLAKDIVDISKINFYPTIGVTAGGKHIRFRAAYQYGLTNIFSNLNSNTTVSNFKGNVSMWNGNMIIYF
ncbi:hypothetical protein FFWV33_04460 [Flavobacterium faecale]|uniref:Outer membrane protein beta-barrel domain-containing protein n=1 Tax=Flavobacterium faecale TaxID=1355330 RepID=A0A2S1LAV3_9FLAO|nr:outer membrane beta-barrel protein [Flavobacterium faecale]AWG20847.1 hypothetical protein FFWV33_04460 [Flavobacterium faecale]